MNSFKTEDIKLLLGEYIEFVVYIAETVVLIVLIVQYFMPSYNAIQTLRTEIDQKKSQYDELVSYAAYLTELANSTLTIEEDIIHYWGDPGRYESNLGVTVRETEEFYSECPNIVFSHPEAFGYLSRGTRKRLGDLKAIELPYWGRAEDVLKLYQK